MKAIKEESFENTSTEEIALEAGNDRCPFVSDLCDTEDSNTSSPVKNDCSAVGPRYKPFRQGIGIGKIGDKALKYICRLKIDLWYLKVLYYKKSSLSIRSLIERPWQKLKYYSPPPDITGQNQIPLLLLTYGIVTDRKSILAGFRCVIVQILYQKCEDNINTQTTQQRYAAANIASHALWFAIFFSLRHKKRKY